MQLSNKRHCTRKIIQESTNGIYQLTINHEAYEKESKQANSNCSNLPDSVIENQFSLPPHLHDVKFHSLFTELITDNRERVRRGLMAAIYLKKMLLPRVL